MMTDTHYTMLIDGKSVDAHAHMDVVDPASGKPFARAPAASADDLDRAVAAARRAFPAWRAATHGQRRECVQAAAQAIAAHVDELAALLTQENGRPTSLTKKEILGAAYWMKELAKLEIPVEIVEDSPTRRIEVHHEPLGVVCGLVAWNFPILLASWKVTHAVITGNTIVLKPSPFTPLTTLKIGELLREIFPKGVLNIITGLDELGPMMTAHPGFAKIAFTGSTATGKRIMATAASDLKRMTMELGGNDAAIVMPYVDLDTVAEQLFAGAFSNSGQTCVAAKRIYIHDDIYDALRDKLHAIAKSMKVGPGAEEGTHYGPVQNLPQYKRVKSLMDESRAAGLTLLHGSAVPETGYFLPLTLVDNPPDDARVVVEEPFGPIVPLMRFSEVEEVIARANDTDYGLAGSVWSKDLDLARSIALRLDAGTVQINQILQSSPGAPISGHKQSGFGVENGVGGLLEFTQSKTIFSPKPA